MNVSRILLFYVLLKQAWSSLSEEETNIFLSLVNSTDVRDCYMAPADISHSGAIKLLKILSDYQVFSVFLAKEQLRKYLEKMDKIVYRWTAVLLKERTLTSVDYFDNKKILPSFFWIIFDGSNGTLRHELLLKEIPHNTALLLVEKIGADYYTLSEYYKIKKNDPGVMQLVFEWKNNSLISTGGHWSDRKSNMHQYEFVTLKFNESLYLTPKEKVNEAIWEELSELLNFTIKQKIIHFHPNHVTEVLDTEEEEALLDTQIYISSDEKFRHLLGPTTQSRLYMHIKTEGEYKGLMRILKPFSKYTWVSIGCWICFCGVFGFLLEYLLRKFKGSEKPWNEAFQNVYIPLDSLCNQCGFEIGHNLSHRFVVLIIRASALVIFYAYSATFISYLLLYIPELPFTDLKGFVEDGTYKIIAERNSDVDTYFSSSSQPLERLVYEKFFSNLSNWSRLDKEVDRMCKGEKLVLVAYDDDVDNYKPCNIIKIKEPLKVLINGFKIRFRSPFRGILHIKLLLLRTTGILERVNRRVFHQNFKTFKQSESYEINVEKVSSVFVIFYYGVASSVVIFAIEIAHAKLNVFCRRGPNQQHRIGGSKSSENTSSIFPFHN